MSSANDINYSICQEQNPKNRKKKNKNINLKNL